MKSAIKRLVIGAMAAGAAAMLAACSTAEPKSRVYLFDRSQYVMTVSGDVVSGVTTTNNGIWLSRHAVELLQREKILP